MRCQCHNSYRRSRFSQFGTQILGKSSFSNKCRMCCASCRSVFCFRTRFAAILAAVSRPQLEVQLCQKTLEPPCVTTRFHAYMHFASYSCQSAIELIRLSPVLESPLLHFPSLGTELDRRFRLMLTATGIGETSALQILGELAVLPDTLDARQ